VQCSAVQCRIRHDRKQRKAEDSAGHHQQCSAVGARYPTPPTCAIVRQQPLGQAIQQADFLGASGSGAGSGAGRGSGGSTHCS
jgi:hypothetical protein